MIDSEFQDVAKELAWKVWQKEVSGTGDLLNYPNLIAERAMLLTAEATRQVCFEYPDTKLTAATNNWQVRDKIRDLIRELP